MGQLIIKRKFITLAIAAGIVSLLHPIFGQIAVGQKPTGLKRNTYYHGDLHTYNGMPVYLSVGCMADLGGLDGMIANADLIVIGKVEKTIEEAGPTIFNGAYGVFDAVT